MHAAAAADTVVLARSSTVPVVPVVLYRYMYTSSGARATFRHHARAEEALQYSSLIATWFKFDDPTVKKGIKFLKGTPFPYPCGGAWDKLCL